MESSKQSSASIVAGRRPWTIKLRPPTYDYDLLDDLTRVTQDNNR